MISEDLLLVTLFLVLFLGFIYFINIEIQNNKPSQELIENKNISDDLSNDSLPIYINNTIDLKILDQLNNISGSLSCALDNNQFHCYYGEKIFSQMQIIITPNIRLVNSTYNISNQYMVYKCYDKRTGNYIFDTNINNITCSEEYVASHYDRCHKLFFTNNINQEKVVDNKYMELVCIFDKIEYSGNKTLNSVLIIDNITQNEIIKIALDE